jgi:hypothetical protein
VLSEQAPRLVPRVPGGRFPGAVEFAAYFAALEALRLAHDDVTVDGAADGERLRFTIRADGLQDGEMTQIRDRVGAVGGTVSASDGELRLEMPCAS